MLKILFFLLVSLHGMIHFMGFAKAFNYGKGLPLTRDISQKVGAFWFLGALLFLAAALLFLFHKKSWPVTAVLAVTVSQFLIISAWKDARLGTIVNLAILLVAIPSWGDFRLQERIADARKKMVQSVTGIRPSVLTGDQLTPLPPVVQQWLRRSGVVDKEDIYFTRLRQKGSMRTRPDGRWMDFTAQEYFTTAEPCFLWSTRVRVMPLINLAGCDRLADGKGSMNIKFMSLFDVVNDSGNDKINQGTLLRYLAEIVWFPSAALKNYIQWTDADNSSARATLSQGGQKVDGLFRFNSNGDFTSFTGDRYYGSGKDAKPEKWYVEATDWKEFSGIRVPVKTNVHWQLATGDFDWLHLEVTGIEYNQPACCDEGDGGNRVLNERL